MENLNLNSLNINLSSNNSTHCNNNNNNTININNNINKKTKNNKENLNDDTSDINIIFHYSNLNQPNRCLKRLLNAGDTFLSIFIISPLVVAHWRGTWNYMNLKNEYFPPWHSFLLGIVLHTTFALLRESLIDEFSQPSNGIKSFGRTLRRFFITKIYTYIFSIGCIMHWRGGWDVMQLYLGPSEWPALTVSFICLIPLIIMRSLRNLIAPPFVILTDHKESIFNFPTRFRIERSREPGLYVLDCLFSVLVIGSLVVFVWRGLWVLLDLRLYPGDAASSAWGSLIIGYGVVGITFAVQPIMRWVCDNLKGIWRIIAADLFLFFSFIGTVNVWRGVWQLLDVYLLPDNKLLSDWLTHGVSILLLVLLNCSNSVLVRGVYIDAEEPAGQCVVFPVYYIRLFFQKERTKKQKRLMDALDRQDQNNTIILLEKPLNNTKIIKNNNVISSTTTDQMEEEIALTKIDEFELDNSNMDKQHTIISTSET